jgi:hypothetical protein
MKSQINLPIPQTSENVRGPLNHGALEILISLFEEIAGFLKDSAPGF